MKVLFDTNVIVDIWGETEDFFHSYVAYDLCVYKGFDPVIATSMMPDFAYLLTARKLIGKHDAREAFGRIMTLFDVLDVTASDCLNAYESKMPDLEDAIIAFAAKRHGVDFIVTRDKRGFKLSPVPALSPQEFVEIYKPTCLDYELVDLP